MSTPAGDRSRPACSSHGGAWQFFARRERRSNAVLFAARTLTQGAKHVRGYLTHPALAPSRSREVSVDPQTKAKTQARSPSRQPHTCAASAMRSIGHRPVPLGPAELSGVPNPRDTVIMMASTATLSPQGKWHALSPRQRHLLAPGIRSKAKCFSFKFSSGMKNSAL